MATDTKTVPWIVHTTSTVAANNTLTALAQITMYLPEFSGTVTFKSVELVWTWDDQVTATGGSLTTKRVDVSLGGAAATTYSNAVAVANSAENISGVWTVDVTSQFVSGWTSGTSKTLDVSVLVNMTTGTTQTTTAHTVVVWVTYEYDDTQTTQIKVVYEPLDSQTGAAGLAFTTRDTFPALDTLLPEASKTYRQVSWVVQGNELTNGSTATDTLVVLADTSTALLTVPITNSLATDRFTVLIADASSLSKNATHTFGYTSSVPRRSHQQCWAIVVYEFDASSNNGSRQSLLMPVSGNGGMAGSASNATTAFPVEFDIQEPGTPSDVKVAFFCFWGAIASITPISARVGTGSFVSYTDTGSVYAGNNALMVRKDNAYTLARGVNRLNAEVYASSFSSSGNMSGFWMVSYSSSKAAGGHGTHAKTRRACVYGMHSASSFSTTYNALSHQPYISQANFRIVHAGLWAGLWTSGSGSFAGISIGVARTSSEQGGPEYFRGFGDLTAHDGEVGVMQCFGSLAGFFWRWVGDPDAGRVDPEVSRFWRAAVGASAAATNSTIVGIANFLTYHAITYTVSGTVYGSAGGTVTLSLHRSDTHEVVLTTSRTGNGAFSFTWYDNTVDVYVVARESDTRLGRSKNGTPGAATLDVVLGPRLGHVSQTRVGRST